MNYMTNIDILMIVYLILICAVVAVTDWKFGKIYNKCLTIGMEGDTQRNACGQRGCKNSCVYGK